MLTIDHIVRNNDIEETEIKIERMIERDGAAIYSDHRGLIFAAIEGGQIEDKVQVQDQGE